MSNLTVSASVDTLMQAADQAGIRTAAGLGTAATHAAEDFDAAGAANTRLAKSSNLSDLEDAASARTHLGLAAIAASGTWSDLQGAPVIGTAANQLVALDGSAKLPAVDGSQLTNLPGPSGLLEAANNLSDVADKAAALAELAPGVAVDGHGNLTTPGFIALGGSPVGSPPDVGIAANSLYRLNIYCAGLNTWQFDSAGTLSYISGGGPGCIVKLGSDALPGVGNGCKITFGVSEDAAIQRMDRGVLGQIATGVQQKSRVYAGDGTNYFEITHDGSNAVFTTSIGGLSLNGSALLTGNDINVHVLAPDGDGSALTGVAKPADVTFASIMTAAGFTADSGGFQSFMAYFGITTFSQFLTLMGITGAPATASAAPVSSVNAEQGIIVGLS